MASTAPATAPLQAALDALSQGRNLSADETASAFGVIMRGEATSGQIGALLLGLRAKGETADEIAGAARALRQAMVAIRATEGRPVVDTCGTGGGLVGTFNISTAAAFVVAASGARVAKHGNRSYTSKCGSADVLEALGIDITLPVERASEVLDSVGIAFLFAPNFHPAMRHVGPTRKELGVPTVMNLLGPLVNPAGVTRQVIGVADPARAPRVAQALASLGAEHAMVVHAELGMDEISPTGMTWVWEIRNGSTVIWQLEPRDYDMAWDRAEDLAGGDPKANGERIEKLLGGAADSSLGGSAARRLGNSADEAGRRAVILNAAAGVYVAGLVGSYEEGVSLVTEVLEKGRAGEVLVRLREISGRVDGSAARL